MRRRRDEKEMREGDEMRTEMRCKNEKREYEIRLIRMRQDQMCRR